MRAVTPVFGSPVELVMTILAPLRDKGVYLYPAFEDNMLMPAVVPLISRRSGSSGYGSASPVYTRVAILELNTITDGPDADEQADLIQEAARKLLLEAWMNQDEVPGVGVINRIDNTVMASAVSDWQTSSGVVQYANLPHGAQRFEAVYRMLIRPPRSTEPLNPFI